MLRIDSVFPTKRRSGKNTDAGIGEEMKIIQEMKVVSNEETTEKHDKKNTRRVGRKRTSAEIRIVINFCRRRFNILGNFSMPRKHVLW